MEQIALTAGLMALAYALGCLSTGYYLARIRTGRDIRSEGSGNAGARNVGRVLGPGAMAITLAGDTAKGALPIIAARVVDIDPWAFIGVALAAVAGHVWPAQLGFSGGKGLATAMGVALVMDFRIVLAALVIAAIGWAVSRNITAGGLIAVALAPFVALVLGIRLEFVAGIGLLSLAMMVTHRDNIRTVLSELKAAIGQGK